MFSNKTYKNEAARFISLVPDSYDASGSEICKEFVQKCWQDFTLESIHSISNVFLRNALYQKLKKWDFIPDCMNAEDCLPFDPELVYSPALHVASILERPSTLEESMGIKFSLKSALEMFRFRKDDPRKKVLFVSAASDFNESLNPFALKEILGFLNSRYDLKYQKVSTEETLRQAVRSRVLTGDLVDIYIDAHGNSRLIQLGNEKTQRMDQSSNFSSIFSDVPPHLVITLLSCEAGKLEVDGADPIAQKMADGAQRTVIAATEVLRTSHLYFSDLGKICHPGRSSQNIFISFTSRK
ncbi:MAG: hypothetical protein K2X08_06810 [Chlamydiales bacterium]|nr:hypothetical protein [Chlamydiales bacterium]